MADVIRCNQTLSGGETIVTSAEFTFSKAFVLKIFWKCSKKVIEFIYTMLYLVYGLMTLNTRPTIEYCQSNANRLHVRIRTDKSLRMHIEVHLPDSVKQTCMTTNKGYSFDMQGIFQGDNQMNGVNSTVETRTSVLRNVDVGNPEQISSVKEQYSQTDFLCEAETVLCKFQTSVVGNVDADNSEQILSVNDKYSQTDFMFEEKTQIRNKQICSEEIVLNRNNRCKSDENILNFVQRPVTKKLPMGQFESKGSWIPKGNNIDYAIDTKEEKQLTPPLDTLTFKKTKVDNYNHRDIVQAQHSLEKPVCGIADDTEQTNEKLSRFNIKRRLPSKAQCAKLNSNHEENSSMFIECVAKPLESTTGLRSRKRRILDSDHRHKCKYVGRYFYSRRHTNNTFLYERKKIKTSKIKKENKGGTWRMTAKRDLDEITHNVLWYFSSKSQDERPHILWPSMHHLLPHVVRPLDKGGTLE